MTTNKAYTDLSQSKILTKILPLESADYHYIVQGEQSYFYPYSLSIDDVKDYDEEIKYIPCWSLAALLSILPKYEIYNNGETIQLDVSLEALAIEGDETLLDLVVNMIIHLHELNLL